MHINSVCLQASHQQAHQQSWHTCLTTSTCTSTVWSHNMHINSFCQQAQQNQHAYQQCLPIHFTSTSTATVLAYMLNSINMHTNSWVSQHTTCTSTISAYRPHINIHIKSFCLYKPNNIQHAHKQFLKVKILQLHLNHELFCHFTVSTTGILDSMGELAHVWNILDE